MYIYIYIYTHTCIHTYIHTRIRERERGDAHLQHVHVDRDAYTLGVLYIL